MAPPHSTENLFSSEEFRAPISVVGALRSTVNSGTVHEPTFYPHLFRKFNITEFIIKKNILEERASELA